MPQVAPRGVSMLPCTYTLHQEVQGTWVQLDELRATLYTSSETCACSELVHDRLRGASVHPPFIHVLVRTDSRQALNEMDRVTVYCTVSIDPYSLVYGRTN